MVDVEDDMDEDDFEDDADMNYVTGGYDGEEDEN